MADYSELDRIKNFVQNKMIGKTFNQLHNIFDDIDFSIRVVKRDGKMLSLEDNFYPDRCNIEVNNNIIVSINIIRSVKWDYLIKLKTILNRQTLQ